MATDLAQYDKAPEKISDEERNAQRVMQALDALGAITTGDDSLIFEGTKFILPASMKGDLKGARKYLRDYEEQQEQHYDYSKEFPFRPWDGAAAFQRAMKRVFGTTGLGATIHTFFGAIPPQFRTVNVAHNRQEQVPWGRVNFSPLDADFYLDAIRHREWGQVFQLRVDAPRKHRARIQGFFDVVADELRQRSIYRGKAFDGAGDPNFLDVNAVDASKVVYNSEVLTQLEANLWALIERSDDMRRLGIPLKRAVLVHGPYGTGKTLAGALTAQRCDTHGWTYILVRPGVDDLFEALRTARLYAPAMVWFEDIDTLARGEDRTDVSKLLDALDGIQSKGVEVMAGFTTNFVDRIEKGVMRPGRIDAVIKIAELDRAGMEKLIKLVVPAEHLSAHVDWDDVAEAMEGFLPAFVREAAERAIRYTVARTKGQMQQIGTADLVAAAQGLREQLQIMESASEAHKAPDVTSTFRDLVQEQINRAQIVDSDGDPVRHGERLQVGANGR